MNSKLTIRILSGAILLALLTASPLFAAQRGNQKVIKDPAEYAAYMNAIKTRDPVAKAAALETFLNTYPDSVVKVEALEHAMAAYQQSGNQSQVLKTAQRILALAPYNVRALAVITLLDRNSVMDGNAQEFCAHAMNGLQAIAGWQSSGEMPEAEYRKLRGQMGEIFLGALGYCALLKKDYSTARDYYLKALQVNPNDLVNVYQLGVAELEMTPMDVTGFWYVSKAINLAQVQGNATSSQGIEEYGKDKYRKYHGSDEGWDTIVKEAASENAPPEGFAAKKRTPTPAELALTAVEQHDPATLSFSDWEFVLTYRDSSAENKNAADKVWHAIQDKQQNGKAKLKIPMKVIGVSSNMIQGAITEDNQAASKADVQIVLQKSIAHLPAVGSKIEILGLITGYTPQPFMFTMGNAELFSPQPEVHTQLSEADIEELLHGGVSPKRATELVKQKGVDFGLDDAAEGRLRKAGATEELLLAIAKGKQ